MIDAVLVAFATRLEDGEVAAGIVRPQDTHLGAQRMARRRHQVLARLAPPEEHAEGLVRLLVDQFVGRVGTEPVPVHLVGPERVGILPDVEQRRAVGGPDQIRGHVGDLVRESLAGFQVPEANGVEAAPHVVDAVSEDPVVRTDRGPDRGVLLALGDLVHVDQHFLGLGILVAAEGVAVRGPAAVDRVLLPLLVAGVVPVVAVAVGNR